MVLSGPWKDVTAVEEVIRHNIPELLRSDRAFQNARSHSDRENTTVEAEQAIKRAISSLLSNYLDLFTKFNQDPDFRSLLTSVVLEMVDGDNAAPSH